MTKAMMIVLLVLAGISMQLLPTAALADAPAVQADREVRSVERLEPVAGGGFSWPLLMSVAVGAGFELGEPEPGRIFTDSPSLRIDMEVGIAGGYLSTGVALPFGEGSFAVNLKAARLRTWLLDLGSDPWSNYNGGILELVTFGHVPGKIGAGLFRPIDRSRSGRGKLWYVSIGVGW